MRTHLSHFVAAVFLCVAGLGASAEPALKEVFRGDFLIGAALSGTQVSNAPGCEISLVQRQFNSITPENVMKWEFIHPEPGTYAFDAADRFVALGEKHKMFIAAHTLVWHSQTPGWVFEESGKPASREVLLRRMREHITSVVGRYKGRVKGWDVVNEALADNGTLRQSPWMKIIGEDYIQKAFEFAHEADPAAELYYNDYGLERKSKRDGAITLIKRLMAQGINVAAVGVQGHYRLDRPLLAEVDETISAFAALGIRVMITELDVDVLPPGNRGLTADVSLREKPDAARNPYVNGLPETVQQQLAQRYADLFAVFLKHRDSISRVTFWGVNDGNSWLNDWPIGGRTSYPLLFGRDCRPKRAFEAVIGTKKAQLSASARILKSL